MELVIARRIRQIGVELTGAAYRLRQRAKGHPEEEARVEGYAKELKTILTEHCGVAEGDLYAPEPKAAAPAPKAPAIKLAAPKKLFAAPVKALPAPEPEAEEEAPLVTPPADPAQLIADLRSGRVELAVVPRAQLVAAAHHLGCQEADTRGKNVKAMRELLLAQMQAPAKAPAPLKLGKPATLGKTSTSVFRLPKRL